MITVQVTRIQIPAYSTLGWGEGLHVDATGTYLVVWAGDHRPMKDILDALRVTHDPLLVQIEQWQVQRMDLLPDTEVNT